MKKIKKLTESDLHKIIKKIVSELEYNVESPLNEELDKDTSECDKKVHPSVKNLIMILRSATNNFNDSLLSNWDEDVIGKVYLSIRSKQTLDLLDRALSCYMKFAPLFGKGHSGASVLLLRTAFGRNEYNKVRPVLVHLANTLGQKDKITSIFDADDITLPEKTAY